MCNFSLSYLYNIVSNFYNYIYYYVEHCVKRVRTIKLKTFKKTSKPLLFKTVYEVNNFAIGIMRNDSLADNRKLTDLADKVNYLVKLKNVFHVMCDRPIIYFIPQQ